MDARIDLFGYLRRAALPAICILLIGYFVSHAINGPTGAIAWRDYKAERARLEAQVAVAAERKAAIAQQVKLLDPAGVDPDMADELVRQNLNVVKPDEIIVPLDSK
ncbi:FtsB family cell division protein [Polymorphobacter fuscus]|uniref:Septum formation initiator family protein n=1 Tax=Sandarakinorhabdus fusca TaxID=1439888 RepID=A0A7C9GNT8_9SPHN|nr:septum formation initiator family protein [Polymorphobacter fuscus]KAB7648871.1 septum formation initiator family protein [Polymorphobacter fuscus]MQT16456.1 septum formation initiator family protein [Polymorphobacter fuscus]NJC07254.1 cell division protein FtsB [Polymorphobacter fuscus]